jgi:transcriptional regulator with XRE-family HTH domain
MTRPHVPNTALRTLLAEAGWTQQALARAVNAIGGEVGERLYYDRTAVAHWLTGSCPNARVLPLACEALSRRLGRAVTPADAGFLPLAHETPGDGPHAASSRPGHALSDLLRGASTSVPYRPAAATPGRWVTDGGTGQGGGMLTRPPETGAVEAARAAVRFFAHVLDAHGGGYAPGTLRAYLIEVVAPSLQAVDSRDCPQLYAEAARLVLLLGLMEADELRHGAAQRCYLMARDLAAESRDQAVWVLVAGTMSAQASGLGHRRVADAAARAAVRGARGASPAVLAFAEAQLAVTRAGFGDREGATRALAAAESALHGADGRGYPFDGYPLDGSPQAALELRRAEALSALGDTPGVVRALERTLASRGAEDRWSTVLTRVRLASVLLSAGRLDEAARHEQALSDESTALCSAAAHQQVEQWRRSLRRFAVRAGQRDQVSL